MPAVFVSGILVGTLNGILEEFRPEKLKNEIEVDQTRISIISICQLLKLRHQVEKI